MQFHYVDNAVFRYQQILRQVRFDKNARKFSRSLSHSSFAVHWLNSATILHVYVEQLVESQIRRRNFGIPWLKPDLYEIPAMIIKLYRISSQSSDYQFHRNFSAKLVTVRGKELYRMYTTLSFAKLPSVSIDTGMQLLWKSRSLHVLLSSNPYSRRVNTVLLVLIGLSLRKNLGSINM